MTSSDPAKVSRPISTPSYDLAVADPAVTGVAGRHPLRGRGLRFVLVDELMRRPSMTVSDMASALRSYGYELGGRASKVISDALRWEVRRGRVQRLGRGSYRYHRAPRSTARRIRLFANRCHAWVVAATRTGALPRTPPNRRPGPKSPRFDPLLPPWVHLDWLWTT